MHAFTHRFARIFQSHFFRLSQDHKGVNKAYNGAECNCMFLPKKGKVQRLFKRESHAYKVTLSHKASTLKSNKTLHYF
ncbi:hypothetical protein H5410_055686 [Solanum commersonii]|uniref:Uncharacterized protein n=1 Tax=Solanum commersonii TaxID=4109 RepID=A0A9J5WKJ6_SOLCO|nr:hypothetical protein H5410_055686 [Solanum commersonii]